METHPPARLARALQLETDAFAALHVCLVAIAESKAGAFWQAQCAMPAALSALESLYRTAGETVERIAGGKPI